MSRRALTTCQGKNLDVHYQSHPEKRKDKTSKNDKREYHKTVYVAGPDMLAVPVSFHTLTYNQFFESVKNMQGTYRCS